MARTRFAFDIGTNSIGWAVAELGPDDKSRLIPTQLLDLGVRIFHNSRKIQDTDIPGETLNAERRTARLMRKHRDHRKRRKAQLMQALIECRLMPKSKEERCKLELCENLYELRAKAAEEKIEPYELGRVLFHLGQRRGFRGKETQEQEEKEGEQEEKSEKKIKEGNKNLRIYLEKKRWTLGQYFYYDRIKKEKTVRFSEYVENEAKRQEKTTIEREDSDENELKSEDERNFFPERAMYKREFQKIKEIQSYHHREVTEKQWDKIRKAIFHQYSIKIPPRGLCQFFSTDEGKGEERAPLCLPSVEHFRIYSDVSNLNYRPLGKGSPIFLDTKKREDLVKELLSKEEGTLTFTQIKKLLGIEGPKVQFNLQRAGGAEERRGLKGAPVDCWLRDKLGDEFDKKFEKLDQRDEIIRIVIGDGTENKEREIDDSEKREKIVQALIKKFDFLPREIAKKLADKSSLPGSTSTGNVSSKFIYAALPYLKDGYKLYDAEVKACEDARKQGFDYWHPNPRELDYRDKSASLKNLASLPYYGELLKRDTFKTGREKENSSLPQDMYGRIPNPTVHVGLNQLRWLINTLIERYGRPFQVCIELSRDLKLPKKKLAEIVKENKKRENERKEFIKKIKEFRGDDGFVNDEEILRFRLWKELGQPALCIYSGATISCTDVINNDDLQIDHILPWALTHDDSESNKILVKARANKDKARRTPYEAFYDKPNYDWQKIITQLDKLSEKGQPYEKKWRSRRWRFGEDALNEFLKSKEEEGGFLPRHMQDTRYLGRCMRKYVEHVCPLVKGTGGGVIISAGTLTGKLRKYMRLQLDEERRLNQLLLKGDDGKRKNRDDHRHHAIDAFVVMHLDRSLINRINRWYGVSETSEQASKRAGDIITHEKFVRLSPEISRQLESKMENLVVSTKRRLYSTTKKFFKDTAYGHIDDPENEGLKPNYRYVCRKPLEKLFGDAVKKEGGKFKMKGNFQIRSPIKVENGEKRAILRDIFEETIKNCLREMHPDEEKKISDEEFTQKCVEEFKRKFKKEFGEKHVGKLGYPKSLRAASSDESGMEKVKMKPRMVPYKKFPGRESKEILTKFKPTPDKPKYKYCPRSEYIYCDVWLVPAHRNRKTGKKEKRKIEMDFVDSYCLARQKNRLGSEKRHPAAKHLLKVYKDDTLAVKVLDDTFLFTVDSFQKREYLNLSRPRIALNYLWDAGKKRTPHYLSKKHFLDADIKIRKISITIDGKYKDLPKGVHPKLYANEKPLLLENLKKRREESH